ncbi:uncharacterized protein LOC113874831 [Abrus precatorius]|uniref:Uncharacterized protein LOC113874831 n=1 Tax=Abrus precatorius TaxID=3816 RepID=A0A8B8MJC9_ABRPR|nr:uncharacterized protein LOC113874831 [Abrus precatorius]
MESLGLFLHKKFEALTVFKSFKICVEKEAGAFITCLRTDRGGEFTFKKFVDFCTQQDISRQLTATYTPQQNGVAERKNRTIMNAEVTFNNDADQSISESISEQIESPVARRATRIRRPPTWMTDYETNLLVEEDDELLAMMLTESADPHTFEEACTSQQWREAMKVEMEAIEKNNTWQLVDPPAEVTPIGIKWVFKTKFNENGHVEKYKARLVAKA